MTSRELIAALGHKLERTAYVVRRIIGVPDYDRYCSHVLTHHPGERPMEREEFIRQRQVDRYNKPGSRCC